MAKKFNTDFFKKHKEIFIRLGITLGVLAGSLLVVLAILDVAIMPVLTKQGSETQVPNVIDLSMQAAQARLDEANLGTIDGGDEFDSQRPKGTIINQVPEAGAIVKKGRKVLLIVSKGSASATVPDVEGFTLREARLQLEKEGLQPGSITWYEDDQKPDGVVIGSLPPPGTVMKLNAEVQLVVNRIESEMMVRVPNFVGLDLDKAKALAEENYLLIGDITYSVDEHLLPETVMSQSVESGQQVKKWTTVDLTLSETE